MSRLLAYPQDFDHIILMGGTPLLANLARMLNKNWPVTVYTSPRQEEEIGPHPNIDIIVTDDINRDICYDKITPKTMALAIGEAWVFGTQIRELFGERLLAYMSIPLPQYRGGAHISWAIMRGEKRWGACLQLITANTVPGEFDDGEIVLRWEYPIPHTCITPADWYDHTQAKDLTALTNFITDIRKGEAFEVKPVPEANSVFLPRLRTADNGWIDWSLTTAPLTRFIRAFDSPYPGARTMLHDNDYGERQVALKTIKFAGREKSFPYQRGLVLRIDDTGLHVATVNGTILVCTVLENGVDITKRVKVGQRFYSPQDRLDAALISVPIYTPKKDSLQ